MLGAPLHSLNDTDNLFLQIIANSWYLTDTDYFDRNWMFIMMYILYLFLN